MTVQEGLSSQGPMSLDDQLCYAIYSAGIAIQRAYKPLLDELGLTYPQYLVMNILWREDGQTVGHIAEQLALESSTLTPLLKRLEAAKLIDRARNPQNERQVVVALTEQGRALKPRATCLAERMLVTSGLSPQALGDLNRGVRDLRDRIYRSIGGWDVATTAD
jgi:MarR family transcriptional regulator, organic hydroperoxide resistance regulator